jgi:hypothetical protein
MGNRHSSSDDDEHTAPDPNNYHKYDDDYGPTDLEDEKDAVEKRGRLPPHHGGRTTIPSTRSRLKALVDDHSTDTGCSTSIEDNSLMTYDDSTTTGTYSSPRPVYDADDVTAMTDMAHDGEDGDDEATTKEGRQERLPRKVLKKASSSSYEDEGDDEETIMIIDAEEEYSRCEENSRSAASANNASRHVKAAKLEKDIKPPNDDEQPKSEEQECKRDDEEEDEDEDDSDDESEMSNKENNSLKEEDAVLLVEGSAGETAERNTARADNASKVSRSAHLKAVDVPASKQTPNDDEASIARMDTCSTKGSKVHVIVPATDTNADEASISTFDTRSTRESVAHVVVVPAVADTPKGPLSSKNKGRRVSHDQDTRPAAEPAKRTKQATKGRLSSKNKESGVSNDQGTHLAAKSTKQGKQVKQAKARIIVPAKEVTRKGPMKIVIASDVETSPQHKIGCMPASLAAKTDVILSIPTNREATTNPKLQQQRAPAASAMRKNLMTVVVASDVETSPQHRLGCMPDTLFPKTDVFHSFQRQQPSNNRKSPDSRLTARDVPVVMNGKIVGSSAAWTAQKPKPETPKRYARNDPNAQQMIQQPKTPSNVLIKESNTNAATSGKAETELKAQVDWKEENVNAVSANPEEMNICAVGVNADEVKVNDVAVNQEEMNVNAAAVNVKEMNVHAVEGNQKETEVCVDDKNVNAVTLEDQVVNVTKAKADAMKLELAVPSGADGKNVDAIPEETQAVNNPGPSAKDNQAGAFTVQTEVENAPGADSKSPQQNTRKVKAKSPKPEDVRIGDRRKSSIAALASSDSRDFESVTSDDFDGIDFAVVEQYEEAFNALLDKHPEFMAENPKLVETIRIAKLQKLLSVTVEVEGELEDYVHSLSAQKAEMESHYHTKLLEAAKKKASREILLQQTLENAQRDTRVLEGLLTWKMISQCESLAKHHSKLQKHLYQQQKATANDPLAILPENLAHVRQAIREAVVQSSDSLPEEQLRQLQMDNAFLNAQATVLEKKLAYVQAAAKKHAWVDSVFRRLDSKQSAQLKQRYQDKLGLTF